MRGGCCSGIGNACAKRADKPDSVRAAKTARDNHSSGAPLLARSSFLPAGDADHACIANDARPLFGIAPGGGYRANCVTAVAVRAYRTVSPLPEPKQISGHRRFTFCCPV